MSRIADLAHRARIALTPAQAERLDALADLLRHTNARINLIARTDVQHVKERHLLHCLALVRRPFAPGSTVVDWGTGGGLPLLPLAICNPDVAFVGVDAVEKKTLAVRAMARTLGLANVETWHGRAEAYGAAHTHSVSRATAPLDMLWTWHAPGAVAGDAPAGAWRPGLVVLKGGDLGGEIAALRQQWTGLHIETAPVGLPGAYYADKHVVTVEAEGEPGMDPGVETGGDESTGRA